jgi:hypothetical protein
MILLDTDHLTLLKYPANPRCAALTARLAASQENEIGTTIISVEEQWRGWLAVIARTRDVLRQVGAYSELVALLDIRRALLAAALDVQLDGRDALKNHADPVVGGLFEYAPFEGGFDLRSKWKVDDESRTKWKVDERLASPITLTDGLRSKSGL